MQEDTREKGNRKKGSAHCEDLALKAAAAYFGDELMGWLGIREKVFRIAPTELVELETRHMYEDFLYEMENGNWYHFEFESDAISLDDLKRFREYEATTARIYKAPVITYVICSSGARELRDSITEGINTYRVRLIRLKNDDADELLKQFAARSEKSLSREDVIPLLFAPMMGGKSNQRDRIFQCIQILHRAEQNFTETESRKMEAILYTLAVKFLSEEELKSIKEAMAMTKLGQMIWDDALEKGREDGRRIGAEQASERYSRLILLLNEDNRGDQIVKIAADPEYREALYKEYSI